MESLVQEVLLPIVLAMLASNGLWALIGKQREKNNVERKMLVVLDNIPPYCCWAEPCTDRQACCHR